MTISVRTLLCHRDVNSGIKCFATAKAAIVEGISFEIFDDGSLTDDDVSFIESRLEDVRVVRRKVRESKVLEVLNSYPACKEFRNQNPLALKLFDCSLFEPKEWLNYLDSDIYFISKVSGLFQTSHSVFMRDVDNAYSLKLRSYLDCPTLLAKINTGIIRFPSSSFNLDILENLLCIPSIVRDFKKNPAWAEQTCFAVLAANTDTRLIDPEDAVVVSKNFRVKDAQNAFAIHAVSSYRDVISLFSSQKLKEDVIELRTVDAKHLSFYYLVKTIIARKYF